MFCVREVALGLAFRGRFDVVERFRAIRWGFVELELGIDGTSWDIGGVRGDLHLWGCCGGLGHGCHCGFVDIMESSED